MSFMELVGILFTSTVIITVIGALGVLLIFNIANAYDLIKTGKFKYVVCRVWQTKDKIRATEKALDRACKLIAGSFDCPWHVFDKNHECQGDEGESCQHPEEAEWECWKKFFKGEQIESKND